MQFAKELNAIPGWMRPWVMTRTTLNSENFVVRQVTTGPDEGNVLDLEESYIAKEQAADSVRPRVGDRLIVARDGCRYIGKAKKIHEGRVAIKLDDSVGADTRMGRVDDCYRIFTSEFE
jgi:hypothetical protein